MVTPRAVDKSESLVESISDDVVNAAVNSGKWNLASTLACSTYCQTNIFCERILFQKRRFESSLIKRFYSTSNGKSQSHHRFMGLQEKLERVVAWKEGRRGWWRRKWGWRRG